MVVRGRLAFDDQGRLVEISENAADPENPQPSEIDPVEFDEIVAATAGVDQLSRSVDAQQNDITNVGALHTDRANIGDLKAGLISDTHWNRDASEASGFDYIPTASELKSNLDVFIDDMNAWGADYVHVNGDIAHGNGTPDPSVYKTWLDEIMTYLEETGGSDGTGLDCQVLYGVGNHECKYLGGSDWGPLPFSQTSDTWYREQIGGYDVITMKTTDGLNGPHAIEQQQLQDVKDWLGANDRPKIVHMHCPTFRTTGEQYDTVSNAAEIDKHLLTDPNVRLVHYGHVHHDRGKYYRNLMQRRGWVHTTTPNFLGGEDFSGTDTVVPFARANLQSTGFGVVESSYSQSDLNYSAPSRWPIGTTTPSETPLGEHNQRHNLIMIDGAELQIDDQSNENGVAQAMFLDPNSKTVYNITPQSGEYDQVFGVDLSGFRELTVGEGRADVDPRVGYKPQSSAPPSPKPGDTAVADGTNWDPDGDGAAEKVIYNGTSWIEDVDLGTSF